jgi:hypothetical protein
LPEASIQRLAAESTTRSTSGPPIWCGGRSDATLEHTGWIADVLDIIGEPEERSPQLEQFATEVMPLLQ